jgi:hypothetical protein
VKLTILTPVFCNFFPREYTLPELERLLPENKKAILERAINSSEYQAYQQTYQAWPIIMACVLGSTPIGVAGLYREVGIYSLFYWPLLVLAGVLIGFVLGLVSKYLRTLALTLVAILNVCGLLRCVLRVDVSAAVVGLVAAFVAYQLIVTLGYWLFSKRSLRLLSSLVTQYLASDDLQL